LVPVLMCPAYISVVSCWSCRRNLWSLARLISALSLRIAVARCLSWYKLKGGTFAFLQSLTVNLLRYW
jgi:uncharacterized membrane protein